MKVATKFNPSYTVAYCSLESGESVLVERGAMAWMSDGLQVSGDLGGGVLKAVVRSAVGKESFLWARYTAEITGAWVAITPRFPGDICAIEIDGNGPSVRSETGSTLATSGLEMSVRTGSASTLLLKEGATLIESSGTGTLVLASYGAIEEFTLAESQPLYVDTGHLVAWDSTVDLRASTLQGVMNSALSGEGIVGQLTGPGRVWLQTRAESQLVSWLFPDRAQG
jgi:uncharacterized protein (TIGR00266 family)